MYEDGIREEGRSIESLICIVQYSRDICNFLCKMKVWEVGFVEFKSKVVLYRKDVFRVKLGFCIRVEMEVNLLYGRILFMYLVY